MNLPNCEIHNLIDYYRTQGAPQDQQMLLTLLREVQAAACPHCIWRIFPIGLRYAEPAEKTAP